MNMNNYLERLKFHIIIWNSDNHLCGKKHLFWFLYDQKPQSKTTKVWTHLLNQN